MIDYSKELMEQHAEIENMIMKLKKSINNYTGLPEGSIRVTASGGGQKQYFYKAKGSLNEIYVPSKNRDFLAKMIQRDYEKRSLEKLVEMEKRLDAFLKKYDPMAIKKMYTNLCEGRKAFVKPLVLSDKEYVQNWMEEHQGEQNPFPEKGLYETEQGEFVRSKSEKIIADTLFKMQVPYRYETRVKLYGNRYAYPDFTCLNVRLRKTMYWEHLGLLGDGDYANKNFGKIENYEHHGIYIGDSLILSFETQERPLMTSDIRRKIELFLK